MIGDFISDDNDLSK